MEIESLKLDFHVDFFPTLNQSSYKSRLKNLSFILELEFYLRTRVLDTRDASFQYCFETWQLTKFFNIYCYLEKKFPLICYSMGLRVACQSKPKPANQLKTKLKKRKKQHRSSLTVRSLFSASFNDSGLQNSIRLAQPSFGLGIHTLFVFLLLYFNIRFVFF